MRRPQPRVPRPGDILVAAPSLVDPNFRKCLVFMLQHDDDGSAGVIINRPSRHTVADMQLPQWAARATVLAGGPVAEDSVLALAAADRLPEYLQAAGAPGIAVVDLDSEADVPPIDGLRIFVGYAGWSEGQLMAEIARDDWHVVAGTADDVLLGDAESSWSRVLRRQRDHTRLWSTLPMLPAAN